MWLIRASLYFLGGFFEFFYRFEIFKFVRIKIKINQEKKGRGRQLKGGGQTWILNYNELQIVN